jgi:hypothetical protein
MLLNTVRRLSNHKYTTLTCILHALCRGQTVSSGHHGHHLRLFMFRGPGVEWVLRIVVTFEWQ